VTVFGTLVFMRKEDTREHDFLISIKPQKLKDLRIFIYEAYFIQSIFSTQRLANLEGKMESVIIVYYACARVQSSHKSERRN
jgi:hypothetical protein